MSIAAPHSAADDGQLLIDYTKKQFLGTPIAVGPGPWIDVAHPNYVGGAKGNGVTNDTAPFLAAISKATAIGGATVFAGPGTYPITQTLALNSTKVRLMGAGSSTILKPAGALPNGLINVSANQCTIESLMIVGQTSVAGNNPAGDAIQISGAAVATRILSVSMFYQNGWFVSFLATCSGYTLIIDNCTARSCLRGIACDGTAAGANSVTALISNTFIDTTTAGDAYFFNIAHDVVMTSCMGAAVGGDAIHLTGFCAGVEVSGGDFTATTDGNFVVHLEAGTGPAPKVNTFTGCIFAYGTYAVAQTLGQGTVLTGCTFNLCRQGSVIVSNGAAGDSLTCVGCVSKENNTDNVGGVGEFSIQNVAPIVRVSNHTFLAGTFALNPISAIAGVKARFEGCAGLNPVGSQAPPVIPASPTGPITNPFVSDMTVCLAAGAGVTVSVVAIGGVATGLSLASGDSVAYRVPAGQTTGLTYAGGAPTWTWFGD